VNATPMAGIGGKRTFQIACHNELPASGTTRMGER
jgi:hypothetical protein